MVSAKANEYCHGDIRKIQNYQNAMDDRKQVWWIFHKNLLTGIGRIGR